MFGFFSLFFFFWRGGGTFYSCVLFLFSWQTFVKQFIGFFILTYFTWIFMYHETHTRLTIRLFWWINLNSLHNAFKAVWINFEVKEKKCFSLSLFYCYYYVKYNSKSRSCKCNKFNYAESSVNSKFKALIWQEFIEKALW